MASLDQIVHTLGDPQLFCEKLMFRGRRYRALLAPWATAAPAFRCPLCGFAGPFVAEGIARRRRLHARCPRCDAYERHRIQKLALDRIRERQLGRFGRCLQFAPDAVTPVLRSMYREVVTADIDPGPGSIRLDITRIDLPDASVDAVFASHVLEHVPDDLAAVRELYRILAPGGLAVLPVPLAGETTIEYPYPEPGEHFHVRAPGLDYFDRYRQVFDAVEVWTSAEFDETAQPWIYEDRTRWPDKGSPRRTPSAGLRHLDAVPICLKSA